MPSFLDFYVNTKFKKGLSARICGYSSICASQCSFGFVGGKTEHQFWRETAPICNLGFTFSKFVLIYLPQK